jgi:hypothetical protein
MAHLLTQLQAAPAAKGKRARADSRRDWWLPVLEGKRAPYVGQTRKLRQRIGVLRFCLDSASKDGQAPNGVLSAVRERFSNLAETDLNELLGTVFDFRNTFVAHVKDELGDRAEADEALRSWIKAIERLHERSASTVAHS